MAQLLFYHIFYRVGYAASIFPIAFTQLHPRSRKKLTILFSLWNARDTTYLTEQCQTLLLREKDFESFKSISTIRPYLLVEYYGLFKHWPVISMSHYPRGIEVRYFIYIYT